MKSRSSFVYLGVAVASLLFAALQPSHQLALDQSLVEAARQGWKVLLPGESSSRGSR